MTRFAKIICPIKSPKLPDKDNTPIKNPINRQALVNLDEVVSLQVIANLGPKEGVVTSLILTLTCRTPGTTFVLGSLTLLNDASKLKKLYDTYDELEKKIMNPADHLITIDCKNFDA